jgi:hypothetical protein
MTNKHYECYRRDGTIGLQLAFISQHELALEMGISIHRGPAGEPGKGLIYQGL